MRSQMVGMGFDFRIARDRDYGCQKGHAPDACFARPNTPPLSIHTSAAAAPPRVGAMNPGEPVPGCHPIIATTISGVIDRAKPKIGHTTVRAATRWIMAEYY